jgi:hypothetical protein
MDKWQESRARLIDLGERSLSSKMRQEWTGDLFSLRVWLDHAFDLGLCRWWEGEEENARVDFAQAASLAADLITRKLPVMNGNLTPEYAGHARNGAIAAALSRRPELAHALFEHAARFASGLVTGEEVEPAVPGEVLSPYTNCPLIQAYSLIRLGRFSGFYALLYPVPFPEARHAKPIWKQTNIHALLEAADISRLVGRAQRIPDDHHKKIVHPLLKALAACLDGMDVEENREVARRALKRCYDNIRDMADFRDLYPLALDLEIAFPQVFGL